MSDDEVKRIGRKLDFFLNENTPVHLKFKDYKFWNGVVLGKRDDGVYLFRDRLEGEKFLFVEDLRDVVEFRELGA